ncbi:DHH family phosphoesterase [Miniphocaeibacter massiliensis]|uniref:DHH family phosphoesterase n=1 Tax=Miniphocaeibacter massiliensis TaxID=2041841 RepID=UPI000C0798D1|nr:bifunctional oligoribonuclease/PAP phosphatase NrnA [Miniphocaeibacter massiliensis]
MNANSFKFKEIIAKNNSFAIISHLSPDGDNLGALLSIFYYLKNLGKKVFAIELDKIPKSLQFVVEDILFTNDTNIEVDVLIALDCGDKKRLGEIDNIFDNAKEIIKIDHHLSEEYYGTLNIVDSNISSTCELISNILFDIDANINDKIATLLLMGILTDTGRFLYERADYNTFITTSKLLKLGAKKDFLMKKLFQSSDLNALKLVNKINNEAEFYYNNKLVISSVTTDVLNKYNLETSDVDEAINYYRDSSEVEVSCMIKQKEDNLFKISFRSKSYIDVNKIAETFGGGGHKFAAGCAVEGSLKFVKNKIIERFKDIEWE